MRIDGGVTAVNEESQFTKASAVADEFVNVCMGEGSTGALECKICQMSVKLGFHSACKGFNSLVILEIHRIGCSHLFGKFQTFFFPVHGYDMIDSHRAQNRNTDQPDRTAALYHHPAVKPEDSCSLSSFHRMNQYGAGLNQDSGIQIQIAYLKYGRASADKKIIGKPAVKMDIVIRKQAVNIRAPHVLFIQVEHGNIRVIFKNHTGNYLIPDF